MNAFPTMAALLQRLLEAGFEQVTLSRRFRAGPPKCRIFLILEQRFRAKKLSRLSLPSTS